MCNENNLKINVERTLLTNQPRFNKFYFCFDGCNQGFLAGCRPFIGADGCHLKIKYGGILLVAVGRDANDQYFPLAFGVVENETKEAWRWFLTLLLKDIRNKRWVFISDQPKVFYLALYMIMNIFLFLYISLCFTYVLLSVSMIHGLMIVFEEWSDRIEHRYCLRHLYANFKSFFGGGTMTRDLLMGAAKATYRQGKNITYKPFFFWVLILVDLDCVYVFMFVFYYTARAVKMEELKMVDVKACEWLMGHDPKLWCKHAFSYYPKCDVLMNNIYACLIPFYVYMLIGSITIKFNS